MRLERALYQKSHLYFLAFFACMLAGFWSTYFTRLSQMGHLALEPGHHQRWNVFPFALVVLLAYHWWFLYGYQFAVWQRFCTWFVAL